MEGMKRPKLCVSNFKTRQLYNKDEANVNAQCFKY